MVPSGMSSCRLGHFCMLTFMPKRPLNFFLLLSNRSEAMNFLSVSPPASISSFAQRPGVPSSWVRGGEILSRLCFDRPSLSGHECMNCTTNELLIAFTNSPVITQPSSICDNGRFSCVAVGVHPADLQNNDDWAKTGNAYHVRLSCRYLLLHYSTIK